MPETCFGKRRLNPLLLLSAHKSKSNLKCRDKYIFVFKNNSNKILRVGVDSLQSCAIKINRDDSSAPNSERHKVIICLKSSCNL